MRKSNEWIVTILLSAAVLAPGSQAGPVPDEIAPEAPATLGYEGNGNEQCTLQRMLIEDADVLNLFGSDRDGDGIKNCRDPDDDNDFLTDEFEDVKGYDQIVKDIDGDGAIDSYDVVPKSASAARTTILPRVYDSTTSCGDWLSTSDPYMDQFTVRLYLGSEVDLWAPTGWHQSSHVENRGNGDLSGLTINSVAPGKVANGLFRLPDDIRAYPYASVSDGSFPSVVLRIGLMDHEHTLPGDDRIDLALGPETIAETRFYLSNDAETWIYSGGDDANCKARVGFSFVDNLGQLALRVAIYHLLHPTELIGTGTPI